MAMRTIPTLSIDVMLCGRSPGRNRANVLSRMGRDVVGQLDGVDTGESTDRLGAGLDPFPAFRGFRFFSVSTANPTLPPTSG